MRSIRLTRDEAEHLTDILLQCKERDHPSTIEIDKEIREVFGMRPRDEEILVRAISEAHRPAEPHGPPPAAPGTPASPTGLAVGP